MSKLLSLKSKYLLGVMIVAAIVVAFAMFATTALAAYTHVGTLRQGSSGSQVVSLQTTLGGLVADGSFGPMTKAAVMAYQSANGLVADGVVGSMTGASLGGMAGGGGSYSAGCTSSSGFSTTTGLPCTSVGGGTLPAGCTSTSGYSPTTGTKCDSSGGAPSGPLAGGTGSITLTASGSYSSENVGEGDKDVKVMAVDVEADNGSDVQLLSTKVEFIQDTAGDPKQIWKYASEVSVWFDGEKVGSADTDGFSKSGNYYSATIPLDGVIVRAGKKMELAFSVSAQSSLESTDIDTDDWNIDLINLRFQDADGIVISESGDAAATAGGTYAKTFDFDSFATATGASLTLTLEDDAINDVHLLDVDDVLDTSHAITSILMDASGSDIWVDEMVSTITTNGETDESVSP